MESLREFLREGVFVPRWWAYAAGLIVAVEAVNGIHDIVRWLG